MIFWCKKCLNASTRPRIEFDEHGVCNACNWVEEKKKLDWSLRERKLENILARHSNKGPFDCIVTVSGGKDGSYVAHTLKSKWGIRPLCLTVRPPLALHIGEENLNSFIGSGFEHLHLSIDTESMRILDRIGFLEYGQGYYGWLTAIHTAVLRVAKNFGISLVFYSEDGEVEYGGSTERKNVPSFGADYMKKTYLSAIYEKIMSLSGLSKSQKYWFEFEGNQLDGMSDLEVTHFSFFEAWDPYRNYLIAKEYCGLKELDEGVIGTFTNFAQNDQELASLHYYLMYLKFGFGRATQDAGIEIRRGAMTREQAINLVRLYDGQPPISGYEKYAEYYQITMDEFLKTLDRFANKNLFHKQGNLWVPKFEVN